MRIYISASFAAQKRLRVQRDLLWAKGHHVVSTWLDEQRMPDGMDRDTFMRKLGMKDVAEIVACDMLIYDDLDPTTRGKNNEYGVALGRYQNCQLWVVSLRKSNPFTVLADRHFENWDQLQGAMPHA